jgi:hypothetical protein
MLTMLFWVVTPCEIVVDTKVSEKHTVPIYRLGIFENRVLRKTFGSSKDEVTGGWRLHIEKLHDL